MKQLILGAALVGTGIIIGASILKHHQRHSQRSVRSSQRSIWRCTVAPTKVRRTADGSYTPTTGRVRACNMDKVSVVGERPAPRCSKWTVD